MFKAGLTYLSIPWLVVLVLVLGLSYFLGHYVLSVEDIQAFLFPVFLLIIPKVPAKAFRILPSPVVYLSAAIWLLGVVHIRGYSLVDVSQPKIYIGRLEHAEKDVELYRDFFVRYNLISQRFSVPRMERVQRDFAGGSGTDRWLKNNSRALMLLTGNFDWIQLKLSNQRSNMLSPTNEKIPADILKQLNDVGLTSTDDIIYLRPSWLDSGFLYSTTPENLSLPSQPQSLSLHFLGWLAQAMLGEEKLKEDKLPIREARRHYLYKAEEVRGSWRSLSPLGLARFFLAGHYFLESIGEGQLEDQSLHCAQRGFVSASEAAPSRHNPELSSAILNNAAIARLYAGYRDRDFNKAFKWFAKAAGLRNHDKSPTRSARIALVNMHLLIESGLIDRYWAK